MTTKTPEWREAEATLLAQYQARLAEIEPILGEYDDLVSRIGALDPSAPRPRRRYSSAGTRRAARGEHDNRFLGIVAEHPEGIRVRDVIQRYRDKGWDTPNQGQYIYKVAERNIAKGVVRKDGDDKLFIIAGEQPQAEQDAAAA